MIKRLSQRLSLLSGNQLMSRRVASSLFLKRGFGAVCNKMLPAVSLLRRRRQLYSSTSTSEAAQQESAEENAEQQLTEEFLSKLQTLEAQLTGDQESQQQQEASDKITEFTKGALERFQEVRKMFADLGATEQAELEASKQLQADLEESKQKQQVIKASLVQAQQGLLNEEEKPKLMEQMRQLNEHIKTLRRALDEDFKQKMKDLNQTRQALRTRSEKELEAIISFLKKEQSAASAAKQEQQQKPSESVAASGAETATAQPNASESKKAGPRTYKYLRPRDIVFLILLFGLCVAYEEFIGNSQEYQVALILNRLFEMTDFREQELARLIARDRDFQLILNKFSHKDSDPILLSGSNGCGKSEFLKQFVWKKSLYSILFQTSEYRPMRPGEERDRVNILESLHRRFVQSIYVGVDKVVPTILLYNLARLRVEMMFSNDPDRHLEEHICKDFPKRLDYVVRAFDILANPSKATPFERWAMWWHLSGPHFENWEERKFASDSKPAFVIDEICDLLPKRVVPDRINLFEEFMSRISIMTDKQNPTAQVLMSTNGSDLLRLLKQDSFGKLNVDVHDFADISDKAAKLTAISTIERNLLDVYKNDKEMTEKTIDMGNSWHAASPDAVATKIIDRLGTRPGLIVRFCSLLKNKSYNALDEELSVYEAQLQGGLHDYLRTLPKNAATFLMDLSSRNEKYIEFKDANRMLGKELLEELMNHDILSLHPYDLKNNLMAPVIAFPDPIIEKAVQQEFASKKGWFW